MIFEKKNIQKYLASAKFFEIFSTGLAAQPVQKVEFYTTKNL